MTAPTSPPQAPQLVFVDGDFNDLAQEMADYLHISDEVKPLLADKIEGASSVKEEVLAKLVRAAPALLSAPEKEFTAASNLLVFLVLKSSDPKKLLPSLCGTFSKPITTSPQNGAGLGLGAMTTVFNLLDAENPIRFNVFMAILRFLKQHGMFETVEPYLKQLPTWFESWGTGEEAQRQMYEEVAELAAEAGNDEASYEYILKALRTFDPDEKDEITSEDAQRLSLRAVRTALLSSTHYLFQDLRAIPSIQALGDSHGVYSQLLDIFAEQDLEDFNDFNDEHEGWIEKEKLDFEKLHRKMRLLTFTSVAASTASREIEYATIARQLQVPGEDVEMWAIDVIRAGLVEGKLSQQRRVFLVHKATYRVFGEKQWQELSTRVDLWRTTLRGVLDVLQAEHSNAKTQRQREAQELERKMAGIGMGGQHGDRGERGDRGGRGDRGQGGGRREQQHRERTDNDD